MAFNYIQPGYSPQLLTRLIKKLWLLCIIPVYLCTTLHPTDLITSTFIISCFLQMAWYRPCHHSVETWTLSCVAFEGETIASSLFINKGVELGHCSLLTAQCTNNRAKTASLLLHWHWLSVAWIEFIFGHDCYIEMFHSQEAQILTDTLQTVSCGLVLPVHHIIVSSQIWRESSSQARTRIICLMTKLHLDWTDEISIMDQTIKIYLRRLSFTLQLTLYSFLTILY